MVQKNPFTKKDEKMSVKELLNLVLIKNGLDGDLASYKEIVDRIEGKTITKTEVDHTTKGEKINVLSLGNGTNPDETTT